jgi:hypothetical protein
MNPKQTSHGARKLAGTSFESPPHVCRVYCAGLWHNTGTAQPACFTTRCNWHCMLQLLPKPQGCCCRQESTMLSSLLAKAMLPATTLLVVMRAASSQPAPGSVTNNTPAVPATQQKHSGKGQCTARNVTHAGAKRDSKARCCSGSHRPGCEQLALHCGCNLVTAPYSVSALFRGEHQHSRKPQCHSRSQPQLPTCPADDAAGSNSSLHAAALGLLVTYLGDCSSSLGGVGGSAASRHQQDLWGSRHGRQQHSSE